MKYELLLNYIYIYRYNKTWMNDPDSPSSPSSPDGPRVGVYVCMYAYAMDALGESELLISLDQIRV